ncbi:MAG: carboxypeptidase-like regulatory domain-containing protein [Pyrinomonadaceae bacterium]|nr:carboxypeptidase-like regulatory domain-containing protein [Pyrinomonadaceae bacterium]
MKRLPKILLPLLLLSAIFGWLPTGGFAQTITATLTGEVKDPNGAVVPNAAVTVTSIETGLAKSAQTNENGRYRITFLPPATYTITVESGGFAKATRENIKLETGQTATLDVDLAITAETNVEVESNETPLLQTETSGLETVIENKLVEDLPSGERSALAFINLVPGAIDAGFAQGRGEGLNENGNAQGPIGSPGNRNFFDSNFSVNGGRSSTNDILLDGVTNTVGDFNGVAVSPPQDSVRELKVIAGSYPAEFGRSGGGVVSITSKSGGKRFNGALYEYYQDGDLSANGWQRNRRGSAANGQPILPRIDFRRNQFGGAIGGPVYALGFGEGTKFINKLERTFFFFNYEGRREDNPFSRELTLPTERQRRGDLGELLTGSPLAVTTATTRTTYAFAAGNPTGTIGAPVFAGQVFSPFGATVPYTQTVVNLATGVATTTTVQGRPAIPLNNLSTLPTCPPGTRSTTVACLDPIAFNVLRFLPSPNQAGLVNNFTFSNTTQFKRDIYAGRIDHTFSQRHSIFGRFSFEDRFQGEPNYFGSVAANVRTVKDRFANFTFNDVFSLTNTVINNFRYGYTYVRARQQPESEGFDITQLGLPASLRDRASVQLFPILTIGGGAAGSTLAGDITGGTIGSSGNRQPRDTHTFADAVTIVTGSHTIKTGGEFRLYRFYPFQFGASGGSPTGLFTFNRNFTRGPLPAVAQNFVTDSGSSLASFFFGLPTSGAQETVSPLTIFHRYGAAFVQDDWKVTRNLTLNLGVRWDFETGTEEVNGLITNFDPQAASNLRGSVNTPTDPFVAAVRPNFNNVSGLLGFPGGAQTKTNFDRFAPRIGFAYRLGDKMTVRAGYGIFFVPVSLEVPAVQGSVFNTSLIQSSQTGQVTGAGTPTVFFNDPFPGGIPAAPGARLGANTLIGRSIIAVEPKRANAFTHNWNLVFQRQLAKNLVLDIAYVGASGRNLPIQGLNLNQIEPEVFQRAADEAALRGLSVATFLTGAAQQVANPFLPLVQSTTNPNGVIPASGTLISNPTVTRLQLLKPFPQYDTVTLFRPHIGYSDYHALQINLQKRFSDGLSATVNYTWSKLLDTGGVGNGAAFLDATNIQNIYDYDSEYSYSTLDVPHRFVASWSYELPYGKNKRFGKNTSGIAKFLLGGWQTSGTYTWQKGTPIQIIASAFSVGIGTPGGGYRPIRASGVENFSTSQARDNVRNSGQWFSPDLFINPPDFVFGDAARTHNDVRRDNYRTLNLSLLKNFQWADGKQKLQLRAEFLNAFNWVVFGTPGNNIDVAPNATQTGFAQVRTQGNTPRNIQLVARYTF